MKRLIAAALLFSAALSAAALPHATQPADADLANALAAAKLAWGMDVPVEIRMDNLNPCPLSPYVANRVSDLETTTTETTTTFEGSAQPVVTRANAYLIQLNSACDWSKLDLAAFVLHEYGHALIGGGWHSKDRHSIMYYIVSGAQAITRQDRELAAAR